MSTGPRETKHVRRLASVSIGVFLMHVVPAAMSAGYILSGSFGQQGWVGVAMHGFVTLSLVFAIRLFQRSGERNAGQVIASARRS